MKRRIHIIPVGDLDVHDAQETCWCHPLVQDDGVVTHNAKDCREAKERQDLENHGGWVGIGERVQGSGMHASQTPVETTKEKRNSLGKQ